MAQEGHIDTQLGWNHKFLDYEIETCFGSCANPNANNVGIISFSITRLKHIRQSPNQYPFDLRWNHKFLDYEIETSLAYNVFGSIPIFWLES